MPYVEGGGEWPPKAVKSYMDEQAVDFKTAIAANPSFFRNPEGFGTWPFGEEWLWEAIATSYLPLLGLLDELGPRAGGKLTLSLTPVLCDQLESDEAMARCQEFLEGVRPASHQLDLDHYGEQGNLAAVAELERSAERYAQAADALARTQQRGGLLGALGVHAAWTSSATHAVLPLLALDPSIELQLSAGIDSHRQRFGGWDGGFWLPECGYAPWLDGQLAEAGVRQTCVELATDPSRQGPYLTETGVRLWPIDRQIIDLVWGANGYPSSHGYRAYDRMTPRHHRLWSTDGTDYDRSEADSLVTTHAAAFVEAVRQRVSDGSLCVCALDTELLGHWWYEGVDWLAAVIDQADQQGLALTALDEDAAERHPAAPLPEQASASSWGTGRDLRTWSEPPVSDLAWQARAAELHVFADPQPSSRALRELLALQSSDWAFLAYRDWAGDYPRERAAQHAQAISDALSGDAEPALRNLAPYLN
jgi:1,4-alpha-glucan branching enzyme